MEYSKIISLAKTCTANVEKYKKAKVGNYSPQTLAYVFSKELLDLKKPVKVYGIKPNDNPQTSKINGGIGKTNCLKLCKLYVNWCEKHDYTAPSYLAFNNHKIDVDMWAYATARMLVTYANTGKLPAKTKVSYLPFYIPPKPKPEPKVEPVPISYSQKIYNHFVDTFGSIDCIDDALEKVQCRGYSGYYDNKFSNWETIDRLADDDDEDKPNCTDIHQMFWHLAKVMGYDVRAIHVMCRSGVGHVRLDFNRGDGWFSRDASCVASCNEITDIWCGNGEHLATNPSWFFEDLEY